MIRVAFICDGFELGGQELGCLAVMQRIDRGRFSPHLYTFRPGSLIAEAAALGIPIMIGHDKPAADRSWTRYDDEAREQFRARLIERLRGDRIDACMVYAWPDGIEAAQQAGVRAIIERVDGMSLITRIEDKSACARIICEANAVRDVILAQRALLNCRAEQIVVIRNGIDLGRFDPTKYDRKTCRTAIGFEERDFVIGAICRIAPEKNLELLIHAVEFLIRRYRNGEREGIGLVIAGPDGGSLGHLEALVAELDLVRCVKFLGATTAVPELLRGFDVFALTSFYEGTPFAVLEAMAMGLPIVATPVGGLPEIIDGNGCFIPVLHPEVAGGVFARILSDVGLYQQLSTTSGKLAQAYDVDRMVRGYESQLDHVMRFPVEDVPGLIQH
jgi:glycosyltransferase involved in cell wall biosynthesis